MRTFLALALLVLVSCSQTFDNNVESETSQVDELIHKNQHLLDSASKITSQADSITSHSISEMSSRVERMNLAVKVKEKTQIVYVFDTIYVPVYSTDEGQAILKKEGLSN